MDVDQSHDDEHKRETPSDDDDEHKRDAPSDGDDFDYKPNDDLQPPPPSDDEESQTVLVAADDGKFYVRGMAIECLDDADSITREHAKAF